MIRWGIWGTGAIAHQVAGDFPLARGGVLHAVASRTLDRSQSFAARHGIAKSYAGLEPLLNDAEVDVVYVATPNDRHAPDSLACIQAGKAVLCEKPFALNLAQAQQVAQAARERKVFCMEAMWTRFIPAVSEAKRCIDAGAIGSVRMMQGNFAYPVSAALKDRVFDPEHGGGAMLDRGVYLISLAQHLLGAPQSARGAKSVGTTGVDEQSTYQLTYAGGALADFTASLRARGSNEVIISGDRGMLRLCDPFYCAHRLVLRSYGEPAAGQTHSVSKSVRDTPALKAIRRRMSPLINVLQRGEVRSFPFAGNGYQFELMEVNRCLGDKRTESKVMGLNDSLAVMQTMDLLRSQMG
jgi:predicted dehydrogenase